MISTPRPSPRSTPDSPAERPRLSKLLGRFGAPTATLLGLTLELTGCARRDAQTSSPQLSDANAARYNTIEDPENLEAEDLAAVEELYAEYKKNHDLRILMPLRKTLGKEGVERAAKIKILEISLELRRHEFYAPEEVYIELINKAREEGDLHLLQRTIKCMSVMPRESITTKGKEVLTAVLRDESLPKSHRQGAGFVLNRFPEDDNLKDERGLFSDLLHEYSELRNQVGEEEALRIWNGQEAME